MHSILTLIVVFGILIYGFASIFFAKDDNKNNEVGEGDNKKHKYNVVQIFINLDNGEVETDIAFFNCLSDEEKMIVRSNLKQSSEIIMNGAMREINNRK